MAAERGRPRDFVDLLAPAERKGFRHLYEVAKEKQPGLEPAQVLFALGRLDSLPIDALPIDAFDLTEEEYVRLLALGDCLATGPQAAEPGAGSLRDGPVPVRLGHLTEVTDGSCGRLQLRYGLLMWQHWAVDGDDTWFGGNATGGL